MLFDFRTRAVIRHSSFRDFDLHEEIFDVSRGSGVRLENCTFTNITVPDNEYVSTSYSDYEFFGGPNGVVFLEYFPEDDAGPLFDITRWRVNDSTFPGNLVDTRVELGTMSDCMFLFEGHLPRSAHPYTPHKPESTRLKEEYAKRAAREHVCHSS